MTTIGRRLSDDAYAKYRFQIQRGSDSFEDDIRVASRILGPHDFLLFNEIMLVSTNTEDERLMLLKMRLE